MLAEAFIQKGGLETIIRGHADDLFLTCASFEPRSNFLTQSMPFYKVKRSAIYINREFNRISATELILNNISKSLEKHSITFDGVSIGSWEDPTVQFRALKKMIAADGRNEAPLRITIDITTFNREALLACLAIVRWAFPKASTRLVYVSPKEYNPLGRCALQKIADGHPIETLSAIKIQEYVWLSRGFRKMRNALGFSGFQKPNLPALLIILPGYEVERPLTLVENLEPSLVLLGRSKDSTKDEFFTRAIQAKDQMFRLFKARQPVEEFLFSCKSVEEGTSDVRPIVQKYYNSHNIFITSLSTKLTAVTTFLIGEEFDRVQITSSIPGEYNTDDYSAGAHEVSVFMMPDKQLASQSI